MSAVRIGYVFNGANTFEPLTINQMTFALYNLSALPKTRVINRLLCPFQSHSVVLAYLENCCMEIRTKL